MQSVAAVVDGVGAPFQLTDVVVDAPRSNEVLVRLVASAMCHTDLAVRSGGISFPLPGVLGHEGAGVVEAVGSGVDHVRPGDHVVLSFASCGSCVSCKGGHPAMCKSSYGLRWGGTRADGTTTLSTEHGPLHGSFFGQSSFARHALVHARAVVRVEDDLPLEHLAPLGCGVQTGAGTVLNVLQPRAGSCLVIAGAGGVGLSAVMAAAATPATRIICTDVVPERLALARELGATEVIDAREHDMAEYLADATGGLGPDYIIETTGQPTVLEQSISSITSGGTIAVVGAAPAGAQISIEVVKIISKVCRIVGIVEGDSDPQRFIPALISLHRQGRLPLERLLRTYPFEDIEIAAADAEAARVIKPVLTFD